MSVAMQTPPPRTTLPIDDLEQLLQALQGEADPAQLLRIDGIFSEDGICRSVHAHVLAQFLCAEDHAEAALALACCLRLVELHAPLTDLYGNGAAAQFCGYPWPEAGEALARVEGLADAYCAAGLWDLNQPLEGLPLTRQERADAEGMSYTGLRPLATAIFEDFVQLATYLVRRGVDLELGTVYDGEPPMNAVDLARERNRAEIHAVATHEQLTRLLAARRGEGAPSDSSPKRRHRIRGAV